MKLSAFVIFVLSFPAFLLAQNAKIDSLEKLLKHTPTTDTNRVLILNDLAFQYQIAGSKRSLALAKEALRLSGRLKYPRGEVNAFRRLGSYYYQLADYSNALRYFKLDQQLAISTRDSDALGWALNGIGTVFHSKSSYPEALRNYLQAVTVFEKLGKQKEAASIMGNAGVLYKEMGNFDLALKYYQRGLSIQEKRADKNEIARFLNNIGGIYSDQGKFQEAEKAFIRSLNLAREEDNTHLEALVLRNLLEMKVNLKDYPTAFN
jgi:tetratricopeptide (TPR) repeat protein